MFSKLDKIGKEISYNVEEDIIDEIDYLLSFSKKNKLPFEMGINYHNLTVSKIQDYIRDNEKRVRIAVKEDNNGFLLYMEKDAS